MDKPQTHCVQRRSENIPLCHLKAIFKRRIIGGKMICLITWPLFLLSLWISKSFTSFSHTTFTLPGSRSSRNTWAQPMSSDGCNPSSSNTRTVKCWVDGSSTTNSKFSFHIGFSSLFYRKLQSIKCSWVGVSINQLQTHQWTYDCFAFLCSTT